MPKKNPVQSMTPDPEVDGGGSVMKDLAGPAAISGMGMAYGISAAKEREERNKKSRDARESRKEAILNQMKYGMKSGGKVKSASARADGIAQRGKTRGKMC
jgi:formiminotetrahydrofolate cyclodeaminase